MPFIQPEHEYQAQERLNKLRHEATVARIENAPTLRGLTASALRWTAGKLEALAGTLVPRVTNADPVGPS